MKTIEIFVFIGAILLFTACGSGSGLPGSGDTTITVSGGDQTQDQTNNQVQNEGEAKCNIACTITPAGNITGDKDCEGSASVVAVIISNIDECSSVNDLRGTANAAAEVEAE